MSFNKDKFVKIGKRARLQKLAYYLREFIIKYEELVADKGNNFNINEKSNNEIKLEDELKFIYFKNDIFQIYSRINLILQWIKEIDKNEFEFPQSFYDLKIFYHKILNLVSDNFYNESNIFDKEKNERTIIKTSVILDNIRSPYNVGSILRTSEAFGVENLALTGITPSLQNSKVKRVSMGCNIHVLYFNYTEEAINYFKKENYKIVCIEKTNSSIDYRNLNIENPCFIFGNEEFGISPEILKKSDYIIYIPMFGKKNSLNVSVAAGIILEDNFNKKFKIH